MKIFSGFLVYLVYFFVGSPFAQNYPDKPVRFISPFPPGGGTDLMGRVLAPPLLQRWGHAFLVENKPGANGSIGSQYVAKSPADGYTLLIGTMGTHGINPSIYPQLGYDPIHDFSAISQLVTSPMMLLVHPSMPAKTVADFIRLAKSQPGRITFSSSGKGSVGHLAGLLLNVTANIQLTHVPYRGSGPATVDLLSGQVQAMLGSPAATLSFVNNHKLRALAQTSRHRSALLMNLPTLAESGLAHYDVSTWYGLWAPALTPKSIVHQLQIEVARILFLPEVKRFLATQGLEPVASTPDILSRQVKLEMTQWAHVTASSALHPE